MSLWSRVANVFRGDRLNREIAEEFESHIDEAIAHGQDAREARRALGHALRQREKSHDVKVVAWLDSLRADAIFGLRQLRRNKVTSFAAVLSLALAIGACTSAFRLIDALLLRPLPISDPARLYAVLLDGFTLQGKPFQWDTASYPVFQRMRAAVKKQAELIAIEPAQRTDLTYRTEQAIEKAEVQHTSGWMFSSFGLRPAAGRLFTEDDDREPGAKPYAVLSYAYWKDRFGRDPEVIGRSFRMGNAVYQIIGVSEERFTGTEPGTIPDIFVPTMMNTYGIRESGDGWLRVFVRPNPGVAIEPLRQRMFAVYRAFEQERAKSWTNIPKELLVGYPREKLLLTPAGAGVSLLQNDYRRALTALGVLVALVMLIACANVANLMTAQAAARAREMALRVSIGAGRWRLVQMVLVESLMLALLAVDLSCAFAWWSAPFVASRINPPDNPVRLVLPADWRVLGFGVLLTIGVTLLFGLMPALRASSVKPWMALKGGDDPHIRRRMMLGMIAAQVAFCCVVLFVAGLFVKTFERLNERPLGFSADRILLLETVTQRAQPAVMWDQVVEELRSVPGVEAAGLANWPLLSGNVDHELVSINGAPPTNVSANFVNVSRGWIGTMKIPLADGRDLRITDASPHAALVNRAFARQYFEGRDPVGKSFATLKLNGIPDRWEIVGLVGDAVYADVHDPALPIAYVPFHWIDAKSAVQPVDHATFIVRTASADPLVLASSLRQKVQRAHPELRVSNIGTEMELVRGQTLRERLLAMLAFFFGSVALLLAGVGLYGVLNYSLLQREREIGIRLALGARTSDVARAVTAGIFSAVCVGAVVGLGLGITSARFVESLLYQVRATDPGVLAFPSVIIFVTALLAAVPTVIRAVRIDPVAMLRAE